MSVRSVNVIRLKLQEYIDRGVFKSLNEVGVSRGTYGFRFTWFAPRPFNLTYTPATRRLVFRRLLPEVSARSSLYKDLKAFVGGRSGDDLPAHRRIDCKRVQVSCLPRSRTVSIVMKLKSGNHYEYSVTKIINLAHEIFVMLHSRYPEYLWEHFDASQE